MKVILTALEELYGLFVDDGAYALAILGWVAIAALILPRLAIERAWLGPVLFAGLAALLLIEIGRTARR